MDVIIANGQKSWSNVGPSRFRDKFPLRRWTKITGRPGNLSVETHHTLPEGPKDARTHDPQT